MMDIHQFIHSVIHSLSLLTNTQRTDQVVHPGSAATVGDTIRNMKQIVPSTLSLV